MDSPLPPTDSRSVLDREVVEAVVTALRSERFSRSTWNEDAMAADRAQLNKWADVVESALSLYAKTVEERDEALAEAAASKGALFLVKVERDRLISSAEARAEKAERERDEARGVTAELSREAFAIAGCTGPTNGTWEQWARGRLKWLAGQLAALSPPLVGGGRSSVADSGSALHGAPSDTEGL